MLDEGDSGLLTVKLAITAFCFLSRPVSLREMEAEDADCRWCEIHGSRRFRCPSRWQE